MVETAKKSPVTADPAVEESNARKGEDNYQASFQDARVTMSQLQNVALQALQNAVETANMISKQAVNQQAINQNAAATSQGLVTDKLMNTQVTEGAALAGIINSAGMSGINQAAIRAVVLEILREKDDA